MGTWGSAQVVQGRELGPPSNGGICHSVVEGGPRHLFSWDGLSCLVLIALGWGFLLQLQKPGRLPDTALPTLQNGTAVMDLAWDPFDPHRLAVGKEPGCPELRRFQAMSGQGSQVSPDLQ